MSRVRKTLSPSRLVLADAHFKRSYDIKILNVQMKQVLKISRLRL